MKKMTKKQIKTGLDFFILNRKIIEIGITKKDYSFLHFDRMYFSETFKKKDEKMLFELIYLIVMTLENADYDIEKELVEEIIFKNIGTYIRGATLYEANNGEIPLEMFDSINEKYPQKILIDYLFNWSCKSLVFQFSSFNVSLYSYICCKSIIDAAIVASEGGFPIGEKLIEKLSWDDSDENDGFDEEFSEEFAKLFDDENDADDDFFDNEEYELEQISNYLDKINSSSSIARRRKLFKEVIEEFPNYVELRLFSANEYSSLRKILDIYDEALEIAKEQIGSDKYFKELEKEKAFWGVTKTRPYMSTLFEKAKALYIYNAGGSAAEIWKRMINLCPNDNLGVRAYLLEFLLSVDAIEPAKELINNYPECGLPELIWTDIMFQLEENKNDKRVKKLIKLAIEINKHVPKLLLNKKKYQAEFPEMVTLGSKHEAELYCGRFKIFWTKENLNRLKDIVAHEGLI